MRHRYGFMILDKNHKPEPRPPALSSIVTMAGQPRTDPGRPPTRRACFETQQLPHLEERPQARLEGRSCAPQHEA